MTIPDQKNFVTAQGMVDFVGSEARQSRRGLWVKKEMMEISGFVLNLSQQVKSELSPVKNYGSICKPYRILKRICRKYSVVSFSVEL